jgi:hypothetical protein
MRHCLYREIYWQTFGNLFKVLKKTPFFIEKIKNNNFSVSPKICSGYALFIHPNVIGSSREKNVLIGNRFFTN